MKLDGKMIISQHVNINDALKAIKSFLKDKPLVDMHFYDTNNGIIVIRKVKFIDGETIFFVEEKL